MNITNAPLMEEGFTIVRETPWQNGWLCKDCCAVKYYESATCTLCGCPGRDRLVEYLNKVQIEGLGKSSFPSFKEGIVTVQVVYGYPSYFGLLKRLFTRPIARYRIRESS